MTQKTALTPSIAARLDRAGRHAAALALCALLGAAPLAWITGRGDWPEAALAFGAAVFVWGIRQCMQPS